MKPAARPPAKPKRPNANELAAIVDEVEFHEAMLVALLDDVGRARRAKSHQAVIAGTRLITTMREKIADMKRGRADPPGGTPHEGKTDAEVVEIVVRAIRGLPDSVIEKIEAACAERRQGAAPHVN